MTESELEHSCQRWPLVGVWLPPESRADFISVVGKTTEGFPCNHRECGSFRQKNWCQRLYGIRVGTDYPRGTSSDVFAVETAIRASLATRSYEDFSFHLRNDPGCGPESIIVLLLAEGEPPLTVQDLEVWSDCAATVSADEETCFLKMLRVSCCLFRAKEALMHLLHVYRNHADEGDGGLFEEGLLYNVMAEVEDALSPSHRETGVEQEEQEG